MSPTPIRDPNAPPDPSELRDIPDHQHAPPSWNVDQRPMNPVAPGAPPSPDYPTGAPPYVPPAEEPAGLAELDTSITKPKAEQQPATKKK